MALGTITVTSQQITSSSAPLTVALLSFAGDATTSAGGVAGIKAAVQAKLKRQVQIIAVLPAGACGGYELRYDVANDKLMFYQSAGSAAAFAEKTGNLSAVTFKVNVLCY